MVNAGKQCTMFCNYGYIYTYTCLYIHLFIVKIYNQIEDAVHRICLLVPQDIDSVQKSVFAVYCYNGVTLNSVIIQVCQNVHSIQCNAI